MCLDPKDIEDFKNALQKIQKKVKKISQTLKEICEEEANDNEETLDEEDWIPKAKKNH